VKAGALCRRAARWCQSVTRLIVSPLAVRQRDESRLRNVYRVTAGGELGQLERPLVVGQDAMAAALELRRVGRYPSALDRPSAVGRDDPTDDRGCGRPGILRLGRRVAR